MKFEFEVVNVNHESSLKKRLTAGRGMGNLTDFGQRHESGSVVWGKIRQFQVGANEGDYNCSQSFCWMSSLWLGSGNYWEKKFKYNLNANL